MIEIDIGVFIHPDHIVMVTERPGLIRILLDNGKEVKVDRTYLNAVSKVIRSGLLNNAV